MQGERTAIARKDGKILRDWLYEIPYREYRETVNTLVKVCGVPKYILDNWRNGRCRIPVLAKKAINEVSLDVSGKEIFTIVLPE